MPKTQNPPLPNDSCASGGTDCSSCGGPGICPGMALLIAYVVGSGTAILTGLEWLGWTVGVSLGLVLLTGAWRFLSRRKRP